MTSAPDQAARSRRLQERVDAVPVWWHSIDLGDGVVTPGRKTDGHDAFLERELRALRLPDLRGRTVLDIGAWDGFYSFTAERLGASRVVALDHYVWSIDWARAIAESDQPHGAGVRFDDLDAIAAVSDPDSLPGKQGFDLAHEALDSRVEAVVDDFMTTDLDRLGTFDVVLYLGVLYHMENPLAALRRLRTVTREVAVIETQATEFASIRDGAVCEFFPGAELADDPTNWWSPNLEAVHGLCRAAGFERVETIAGPPQPKRRRARMRYRAIVHAWAA